MEPVLETTPPARLGRVRMVLPLSFAHAGQVGRLALQRSSPVALEVLQCTAVHRGTWGSVLGIDHNLRYHAGFCD